MGGLVVFRLAFSFALAPLPYVVTPELFPQEARAAGAGLSWTANWTTNFLIWQSFPVARDDLGAVVGPDLAAAAIFAVIFCFTFVAFCAVHIMLPETAGVRLS